jgi:GNAT superfamily N-acetyltransferase
MSSGPPLEETRGEYTVSTDPARLDAGAVHAYLSVESYWAKGIPLETVRRSLEGSLCFGLYHGAEQVGLARVISDHATYAYLCDVYVLPAHRGRGLSRWMMECVLRHPRLQGLRRFNLATHDAHGLYRQFGFQPLAHPGRHMERVRRDVYLVAGAPLAETAATETD